MFYTVITGWDNLKYLHKSFFQKSTIFESSASKEYFEEIEMILQKLRHYFCWAHVQL